METTLGSVTRLQCGGRLTPRAMLTRLARCLASTAAPQGFRSLPGKRSHIAGRRSTWYRAGPHAQHGEPSRSSHPGRLDRGTDLFDGVRALCQKHRVRCGELRGIGSLELAELAAFDQDSRRWKPSRLIAGGGLELLHLHGNIAEESGAVAIQAQVTLMRDRDAGLEVVGGSLKAAVVYSVELVIETSTSALRRQADAPPGCRAGRGYGRVRGPAPPAESTAAPPRRRGRGAAAVPPRRRARGAERAAASGDPSVTPPATHQRPRPGRPRARTAHDGDGDYDLGHVEPRPSRPPTDRIAGARVPDESPLNDGDVICTRASSAASSTGRGQRRVRRAAAQRRVGLSLEVCASRPTAGIWPAIYTATFL